MIVLENIQCMEDCTQIILHNVNTWRGSYPDHYSIRWGSYPDHYSIRWGSYPDHYSIRWGSYPDHYSIRWAHTQTIAVSDGPIPRPLQYQMGLIPRPSQYQAGFIPTPLQYQMGLIPRPLQYQMGLIPRPLQYQTRLIPRPLQYQTRLIPRPLRGSYYYHDCITQWQVGIHQKTWPKRTPMSSAMFFTETLTDIVYTAFILPTDVITYLIIPYDFNSSTGIWSVVATSSYHSGHYLPSDLSCQP